MRKGQQNCFSKSNFDRFLLGREAKAARPASPSSSTSLLSSFSLSSSSSTLLSSLQQQHILLCLCLSFELSLSVRGAAPTLPRPTHPLSSLARLRPRPTCRPFRPTPTTPRSSPMSSSPDQRCRPSRQSSVRDPDGSVGLAVFWDTQLTICSPPSSLCCVLSTVLTGASLPIYSLSGLR